MTIRPIGYARDAMAYAIHHPLDAVLVMGIPVVAGMFIYGIAADSSNFVRASYTTSFGELAVVGGRVVIGYIIGWYGR